MTAKLYIASYDVLGGYAAGEEHLFLVYDQNLDNNNDPTDAEDVYILRGDQAGTIVYQ